MAEQDKPTLVPSVLNDLVDVDGTPSEGDGLAYSDGAWRPGVAAGFLPPKGAALGLWEGVNTDTHADSNAIGAAWENLTMTQSEWLAPQWLPLQPDMGAWSGADGAQTWRPTVPGVYQWHSYTMAVINGVAHASAILTIHPAADAMAAYIYVPHVAPQLINRTLEYDAGTYWQRRYDSGIGFFSQGQIDAGWAGVTIPSPQYETPGSERVSNLRCALLLARLAPGSEVDYFGDL